MRYIGLALYAEGPTDYAFLPPLLLRLATELCACEGRSAVDFSPVEPLNHPREADELPREQRIVHAAERHRGAWQILFVHADADSDPRAARAERVDPALRALGEAFGGEGLGVGVIPVRMTESWLLQDGDALRAVLGTTLSDKDLGLPPSPRAVESALDPKSLLDGAFRRSRPSPRRLRQGMAPMLAALGEQVSLQRLEALPSFAALRDDLRSAFADMKVV